MDNSLENSTLQMENSKIKNDAMIEYWNRKLEKLDAQIKKIESKLWNDDDLKFESLEWEMLSIELSDLRDQRFAADKFISDHRLYRYDEFVIVAQEREMFSGYEVEGDDKWRIKLSPSQMKALRSEMRMACITEAGTRFTVRVEKFCRSAVSFRIERILPENASETEKLWASFETRSGIISSRGKVA